jgi:hypothetical protein
MITPRRAESTIRPKRSARALSPATTHRLVLALLVIAMAFGAWLRFVHIDAREMSADESATWAAAAAPNLQTVVREQALLNPGKLALEEIALHGWMKLFGEGLGAMRALSAAFDTLSILVVFLLTRELFSDSPTPSLSEGAEGAARHPVLALGAIARDDADMVAALAALLFAVDLISIKYAREVRMYALTLLLVLAQVWFFLRAARRGGFFNVAAIAVLTALAAGAHFSTAFMIAAEGLCLPFLAKSQSRSDTDQRGDGYARGGRIARWVTQLPFSLAAALVAGVAIFVVIAVPALRSGESAFVHGATSWIKPPPWWAPLSLFNKGTGTFPFPVLMGLAGCGVWRGWSGGARGAVAFALAWMWLPPTLLLIASYGFAPMFVERYVLWCFVPFFILAARGIRELPTTATRAAALAFAVALALGHIHTYRRRPHGIQWREATRAAARGLKPGATIAVGPPYAVNVVRYYLRNTDAANAAVPAGDARAEVLIADQRWIARDKAAKPLADYPRPVARVRGILVLRRRTRAR